MLISNILSLFSKKHSKEDILNVGLSMAMEFGSNWLQPVQSRLQKKYKQLSVKELDEYNAICQEAMHRGNNYVYQALDKLIESNSNISNSIFKKQFSDYIKDHFVWINNNNINHLYSQGCYYAYKDGLSNAIVN